MKKYRKLNNPKVLIGKRFEVRDGKFSDKDFRISNAHWAADNEKELCIWGYPDKLHMLYTLLPNEKGEYNLERIIDYD